MDIFKSLTVGAKFSQSRNSVPLKLFSQGKAPKPLIGSLELLNQVDNVEEGKKLNNSVFSPQPSLNIDMFENASVHQSGGIAPGAIGGDSQGKKTPKSNPLKPMSYKKMKNTWRKSDLQVTGIDVPPPITHFSDLVRPPLNVQTNVVGNLFEREHKTPTPIQLQAIPTLIYQRDVLACAPTGSGKTIAFLVPMFTLLKEPSREAGVRALVVSPTVELAQQIEREAFFLMKGQRWRFVQHGQTTSNKDIMISSPGRIVSLLEKKKLDLSHVQYIVFDEGDRLWDVGTDFLVVVDKILAACSRKDKVISLFTATLSEKIEGAARTVMRSDPIRIIVRGRQSSNIKVQQKLVFCGNELGKIVEMRNLIREGITPPVLIFVQSIERTKELYDEIHSQGLHVALINSKMSIEERDETVLNFRLGKTWFLITTELLSRGIDFKNVGTVINFDFPLSVESYIHRVGRTGRAGKHGTAITFFTEDDRDRLPPVAKIIKESGNDVEDWILEIKVDRTLRRRLERTTPRRMVVSTRKRMLIADQRIERQYRRLEKEEAAKTS
ncbi:unnamed protein product [Phytomonas sp. Hart1]|nr:unnamed protein product [Phytomonas sp. Hart1]|eukprot:CCW70557.1 unnamed protein product [Phytomonas sp. isolate Hart1]